MIAESRRLTKSATWERMQQRGLHKICAGSIYGLLGPNGIVRRLG